MGTEPGADQSSKPGSTRRHRVMRSPPPDYVGSWEQHSLFTGSSSAGSPGGSASSRAQAEAEPLPLALDALIDGLPTEEQRECVRKALHLLRSSSDHPNWPDQINRVRAATCLVLGMALDSGQAARLGAALATLFRTEHAAIKEYYDHERLERIEDLVLAVKDAMWERLKIHLGPEVIPRALADMADIERLILDEFRGG